MLMTNITELGLQSRATRLRLEVYVVLLPCPLCPHREDHRDCCFACFPTRTQPDLKPDLNPYLNPGPG